MNNVSEQIREWWVEALLQESASAHPVFGHKISASLDGDVVTLTGTVDSVEQKKEAEAEAYSIDFVSTVINHLDVEETPGDVFHMQTVLAVFHDRRTAELGAQAIAAATIHHGEDPQVIDDAEEAQRLLEELAGEAKVGEGAVASRVKAVRDGHVLLVCRVPEDDVLRVLSILEGSHAKSFSTLPPEPDTIEGQ